MADALIGHTGFVGGHLAAQHRFDEAFNSKDIESIAGREYELLVCAAAPGVKWKANQDPAGDRAAIERLVRSVSGARARKAILISTVDVYPDPVGVDEDHAIVPGSAAYGRHRLLLERAFRDRFDTLVVRLPGLFGRGLRKNVIFDLLQGHETDKIHADSRFQFFDLEGLWRGVSAALGAGVAVVNFATEPVTVEEVAREGLGIEFHNRPPLEPVVYDVRSRHARLFGGAGGYLQGRLAVLGAIRRFAEGWRAA